MERRVKHAHLGHIRQQLGKRLNAAGFSRVM